MKFVHVLYNSWMFGANIMGNMFIKFENKTHFCASK